ncbi:MAG TPA: hypothetical protein GXZ90_01150 [Clostridiales bacterium]|nr:hypothetical protein [Clostridiales bacterium]
MYHYGYEIFILSLISLVIVVSVRMLTGISWDLLCSI